MPNAARLSDQPFVAPANTSPSWSGDAYGEVGAMHRAIEQRLAAGAFDLAVIPLPERPAERLVAQLSRAAGWLTLAGAATSVAATIILR